MSKKIAVIKAGNTRMPIQSKVGTGLNSQGNPYAVASKVAVISAHTQRRPIGRK